MRTRMRAIALVGVVVISAALLTAVEASPEGVPLSFNPCFWVSFDPPGLEPIPFPKVAFEPGTVKPIPMPGVMPRPVPVSVESDEPGMPRSSTAIPSHALDPVEPPDLCNDPPH